MSRDFELMTIEDMHGLAAHKGLADGVDRLTFASSDPRLARCALRFYEELGVAVFVDGSSFTLFARAPGADPAGGLVALHQEIGFWDPVPDKLTLASLLMGWNSELFAAIEARGVDQASTRPAGRPALAGKKRPPL